MEKTIRTANVKHLFIDIVSYTVDRTVEAQSDLIETLNNVVIKSVKDFGIQKENLIYIPTGDGMCISILDLDDPYDIHIGLALGILEEIYKHNKSEKDPMRQFEVRIGINENLDNIITDINGNTNVSGNGINHAARIESLADKSQILIGNGVFEKIVNREAYMDSFRTYSKAVKHDLVLQVHQLVIKGYPALNIEPPSKISPAKRKKTLTELQIEYLKICIEYEEFCSSKLKENPGSRFTLNVLLMQLTIDKLEKNKTSRTNPEPTVRVKREVNDHFNFLHKIDFWVICDLGSGYIKDHLQDIPEMFDEAFLFLSSAGKKECG